MSEIRATTISNLAGTGPATLTGQSAAKAWVRLGPAGLADSFNISGFTDNGVGDFSVSLTSAMSDGNYATSSSGSSSVSTEVTNDSQLAGSLKFLVATSAGTLTDRGASGSIHGDLA